MAYSMWQARSAASVPKASAKGDDAWMPAGAGGGEGGLRQPVAKKGSRTHKRRIRRAPPSNDAEKGVGPCLPGAVPVFLGAFAILIPFITFIPAIPPPGVYRRKGRKSKFPFIGDFCLTA